MDSNGSLRVAVAAQVETGKWIANYEQNILERRVKKPVGCLQMCFRVNCTSNPFAP